MATAMPEFYQCRESTRLMSFKNWPFQENNKCSALELARAGFYNPDSSEPDLAKCFVCDKELDGWEPNDIPWKEHEAHSPECPFIKLGKVEDEMTVDDFLKLHCERMTHQIKKYSEKKKEELKEKANDVRKKITDLL